MMIGKMPSMMLQIDWPRKPRGRMCPWLPVMMSSILQRRRRLRKFKSNRMSVKEREKVHKRKQLK